MLLLSWLEYPKEKVVFNRITWKDKIRTKRAFINQLQFVTLKLGSVELLTLTCCAWLPFPPPFQCWPRNWTTPPKNHYYTTLANWKGKSEVLDSGGSRGGARGARPSPLILRPNWGPKGRQNFFGRLRSPTPLSKGLDDRPPPSLISRSGLSTANAVWPKLGVPDCSFL